MRTRSSWVVCVIALAAAARAAAALSVSLAPSVPEPQPVGTAIRWTATVAGANGPVWYRFSVSDNGAPAAIVQDFGPDNFFTWVPGLHEGSYTISVDARENASSQTASNSRSYAVTPRAVGGSPAASHTGNPLVALYSAPPCPSGSRFRVRFRISNQANYQATPVVPCSNAFSMNQYVAGLYPNTSYTLISDVLTGPRIASSAPVTFTTGAIGISLPTVTAVTPPQQPGSFAQGTVLYFPLNGAGTGFATDLAGKVIWYYPAFISYMTRPVAGGTLMTATHSNTWERNTLAEIDLAGNTLRQTNAVRISEQLPQLGIPETVTAFHHEARKLANGDYLVLAATERILNGQQGSGNIDVLGDMILVLDPNFQVIWAWDSFRHLDVTRKAVLGEVCHSGLVAGCPPIFKASVANDWLHGNSLALSPDGNIIYSARHQDFIYKISYQNGPGDGHVIWKLGKGGDFSTNSSDPYPWQSHQHDVEYEGNSTLMTLFDNGNTRHAQMGGNSRGQAFYVDEVNRTFTFLLNADLGEYSSALGSAQKLADGNFHFEAGLAAPSFAVELTPSGAVVYKATNTGRTYRSFRMKSLYEF